MLSAKAGNQPIVDSLIARLREPQQHPPLELFQIYYAIADLSQDPLIRIEYCNKAIHLARQHKLGVAYEGAILYLGGAYMQHGDLVKAISNFFEASRLYQRSGNLIGVATAYDYIARAYSQQDNTALSVHYFRKSIGIFKAEQDSFRQASSQLNLGYHYFKAQKPDSALIHTLEAHDIFESIPWEMGIAYALGNTGLIYASLGQDEKAESYLEQSLASLSDMQDSYGTTEYLLEMGGIYQTRNELKKALEYSLESYALAKENGYKAFIRDSSKKLSELYYLAGQSDKAYLYQKEFITYRDSIVSQETIHKIADLRTEFELSQQQLEIDYLKESARKHQLLLIGLGLLGLLGGLVIILLIRYNRLKSASNKTLRLQKNELEAQRNQLESLNHTRNKFFSIISHDLRGPVNAFSGISSLIRHYITNNEMQKLEEVSIYIDRSASQLASLLDNLLSWSVQQQGAFPYAPEKILLNDLLQDILEMHRSMAHAKNIRLQLQQEAEIWIWADSNSVSTIMRNLLGNAIKFTPQGGVVSIRSAIQHTHAAIFIKDNGIGMSAEKINNLINKQEEKRTWGTSGEKGLGLGLGLAFTFAELNLGSIQVESKEGVGTTFTVLLPLFESVRMPNQMSQSLQPNTTSPH